MKNKLAILSLVFVPVVCFASFGEQFNSLLERFFDDTPEPQVEEILEPPLHIIEEFEETSEAGNGNIREAIMREETELQKIESQLRHDELQLADIATERQLVEFQLQNLDGDLGVVQQQQEKYNEAVIKWRRELEKVTREKSRIEAELRYAQKEKEDLLQKKYLRSNLSKSQGEFSVWNWVFSDKKISQLIEKKRRDDSVEKAQMSLVGGLEAMQKNLHDEEQRVARIYLHVQELEREHAKQQALLAQLAGARANVLARLEFTQGDLQNEISQDRERQAQATINLQNLRQKLGEEEEVVVSVVLEKLSYPLRITPRITAKFKDEEYKRVLKREHYGTDFWAPQGTPFYAPADGVIKKVAQNGYSYSYLVVEHEDNLFTVFGHISDASVVEGQKVSRGDLLGKTGGTAGTPGAGFFTSGPHLHFEVFYDGEHVDPEQWLEI